MSDTLAERLFARARKPRPVAGGTYLFHRGDPVRSLYLVCAGSVELVRHQENGASVILQRAGAGAILAEASAYSDTYHCDGVAVAPSEIRELTVPAFHRILGADRDLADGWAAYLAREVQASRYRGEILSKKTVAERLDGWLVWHDRGLPPKGAWKEVAGEIGVTPEALYREIARRRRGS